MVLTGAADGTENGRPFNIVSVKEFGAAGNDSADDTAAIQSAIDYVAVNKGVLVFPPGIYKTTGTLLIKDGIYIAGLFERGEYETGKYAGSMIKYYGSGTAVRAHHPNGMMFGFKMQYLRIGNGNNLKGSTIGIDLDSASEFTIRDCHINGDFNIGIRLNNTSISKIENCDLSANNIGILLDKTMSSDSNVALWITNCNFWENSVAQIKMTEGTSISIYNNWFEHSPAGLLITNDNTLRSCGLEQIYFGKNHVSNGSESPYADARAIKILATGAATDMFITNCIVEYNILYCHRSRYIIEIDYETQGSSGGSFGRLLSARNIFYGAQVSSIYGNSGKCTVEVDSFVSQNGYASGTDVPAFSGKLKIVGKNSFSYDRTDLFGALGLGNIKSPSAEPKEGDIYFDSGNGEKILRLYDGKTFQRIPCQAAAQLNSTASTIAALRKDFNDLLQKLRNARVIAT